MSKFLKTIIKNELQDNEHIWIQPPHRDLEEEWWKFDEYTLDNIFSVYSGKEQVKRFWHEDGLCIILK